MQRRPVSDTPARQQAWDELQCYTLAHGDAAFIHQHAVDAWTAQHADSNTKPIALAFALVGLYLHLERGLSGREVQRAHMALAGRSKSWPSFPLPPTRGTISPVEVLAFPAGADRDQAIDDWCVLVWSAFSESHPATVQLLQRHHIT